MVYGEEYIDPILQQTGTVTTLSNGKTIITFGENGEIIYTVKKKSYDLQGNIYYELERSKLGDEIVKLYLENSGCCLDADCCVASFHRFEQAFENLNKITLNDYLLSKKYLYGRGNFRAIWYSSFVDFDWRKISPEYAGKGGAGAVESASLGKSINKEQIMLGFLKPGAVVQYWHKKEVYEKFANGEWNTFITRPRGHSFIFLGYIYNDKGSIIGMNQWLYNYPGYATVFWETAPIFWGTNYED